MPNWLAKVKNWFLRFAPTSLTSHNIDVKEVLLGLRDSFFKRVTAARKVSIAVGLWFRRVARRIEQTPILVKVQIALLTVILCFIFWQFMAYEFSQTTFISVNIVMAVALTSATAIISVRSQRGVDEAQRTIDELKGDLVSRDQELDRLRTSLFEIRNKDRRQNTDKKGAGRFVDTVKKMRANTKPDTDGTMQFIIDAIGVCFDITGAVAYERWDDLAPEAGETADGEEPEKQPAKFVIAGRFGLSDEPPTMVFLEDEGILGQVATSNKPLTLEKVPVEYLTALSGLGRSRNINVYVLPFAGADGDVRAVVEVASFEKLKIVDAWESIQTQLREII